MNSTITAATALAAAALVWFTSAAPAEAGGSAWRQQNFGVPSLFHDRSFHRHRSPGYRPYGGGFILPQRAIVQSLIARQYCRVSRLRFRRGFYHARAEDAYGRRVRLLIDPYSGEIIRRRYR